MLTVCIATYNGEKYIRQQLESILKQISETDEIIISDDGSKDRTLDIVKEIGDKRICVYNHIKRKAKFNIDYATANFENALTKAKGDIIILSDQDDVWLDNKVETIVKTLDNNDMVMSDCHVTDERLNIIHQSYYKDCRRFEQSLWYNFHHPSFLGSCMAFRREVLKRALPFPKYGVGHDLWLGMVGLRYYRFAFIDTPLMNYRRHSLSVTDGGKENHTSLWFKISYRLYVLKAMLGLIKP